MKIFLAEDAALIRAGLQEVLEAAGHDVIGSVGDATALIDGVDEVAHRGELPDVVVTDVRMPPNNSDDGLRAAIELRQRHRGLPVVVLSAHASGPYARALLSDSTDGAIGYLLKERVGHVADFLSSLDVVAHGGVVVDPQVVARLNTHESGPMARLTPREREVLQLMASGLSNNQIAERLYLSQAAVGKHVANVFLKLDLPPSEENRRVRAVLTWLQYSET